MIVGTLLVPVSALAAVYLTGPSQAEAGETSPVASTSALFSSQARMDAEFASLPQNQDDPNLEEDLANACGPAGEELVTLEATGSITDLQQAALDALRGICEENGTPLPGKLAPEPVVQTVVVSGPAQGSSVDGQDHEEYEEEHEEEHQEEHDEHDEHDD